MIENFHASVVSYHPGLEFFCAMQIFTGVFFGDFPFVGKRGEMLSSYYILYLEIKIIKFLWDMLLVGSGFVQSLLIPKVFPQGLVLFKVPSRGSEGRDLVMV